MHNPSFIFKTFAFFVSMVTDVRGVAINAFPPHNLVNEYLI
jgi:hypothetical protein